MTGKGGKDVSFCIGEYGDESSVLSIAIIADAAVAIVNAKLCCMTGNGLGCAFPGFADMPEYIIDGYAEFACTGMAWHFVIVPFEYMRHCVYAKVIIGSLQFPFAHVR